MTSRSGTALGRMFRRVREKHENSPTQMAAVSGVSRMQIYRLERGLGSIQFETLRKLAEKGLGLAPSSPDWLALQAEWMRVYGGIKSLDSQSIIKRLSHIMAGENAEADRFFAAVAALPPEDFQALAKAIARPSVLKAIHSLNAIYEAKK